MPKRISPQEALELMSAGYSYIDVRSVAEFGRGHPAGALNIPLLDHDPSLGGLVANSLFLPAMRSLFPLDAGLVIGCQVGGRSLRAVLLLEQEGFTSVVDQRAGFDGAKDSMGRVTEPGWVKLGFPVEEEAGGPNSWQALRAKAGV